MARALKVFRTAAGFHDAYVAAPSRKAALAAWGADVDLFARGVAEEVTDPKLTAAPLERPGEVVMVSRGGLADQLKALGPRRAKAARPPAVRKRRPPSRAGLDRAEAALARAEARMAAEKEALEAEQARLQAEIDALTARHQRERARLRQRRKEAEAAYRDALGDWSA